jgi:translation initiation factor IF-2
MPHEPGEITQHISAFKIDKPEITFIDTPGHASFQLMRERGAKGADIAVIIIAADEGPKAQTTQAYKLAKKAKIPIIIALNKVDKARINLEKVKEKIKEFTKAEIVVEVSAETGQGLDELLEAINLEAEELDLEIKNNQLDIEILESHHDNQQGSSIDVIIRSGELKIGDVIEGFLGKVKRIEDEHKNSLKNITPGMPGRIYGPEKESSKEPITEIEKDRAKIILKAKNEGILDALEALIEPLEVQTIVSGVGNINEKDLLQGDDRTIVVGFQVKVEPSAQKYSEKHGITILVDDIIYHLEKAVEEEIENIKKKFSGLKTKEKVELGQMEIIATFKNFKDGMLAGGPVTEGKVALGSNADVKRDGKKVGSGQIKELQNKNKPVQEVEQDLEAGIYFQGKLRLRIGDILEIWRME